MNRTLLFFSAALAISPAFAQDTRPSNPTPSGMLVPLMSDEHMRERAPRGQGELIFNQDQHAFYYFNGTDWEALLGAEPGTRGEGLHWTVQRTGGHGGEQRLTTGTSGFWDLTGNAATDPATDFIGTTDAQPVMFRANNQKAGQLGALTNSTVSFGFLAGSANTTGTGNVFIGGQAGLANTSGGGNVAVGNSAGKANITGQASVFVGNAAGFSCTGSFNAYLGGNAGLGTTTGGNNTFIGHNSGMANTTGAGNVCLGANAGQTAALDNDNTLLGGNTDIFVAGITNATAIGNRATVSTSNGLVLGSVAGVNGATNSVNVGIGVINPADRLHVAGNIRMVDGNQAAGKVLTSDANGTGTWQTLPAASADWGRTGNAGTNASTNFIGTTDAVDFKLRTNNAERVTVSSTGKVGFGTSAPSNTVSVNGGLALLHTGNLALAGGANTITVGDRSMFRFSSSVAGASIVLSDGISIGQLLLLQYASGGGIATVSIADVAATSNCNLQAARTLGVGDTIILMWDGLDWLEIAFANN